MVTGGECGLKEERAYSQAVKCDAHSGVKANGVFEVDRNAVLRI